MTDTEINIAIAESLGWDFDPFEAHEWGSRGRWCKSPEGEMRFRHDCPDHCNDLNAMADAEKTLTFSQCNRYSKFLTGILDANAETTKSEAENFYWHATARQRAESFLLTLEKWRGGV
jgi:hypothetical protein